MIQSLHYAYAINTLKCLATYPIKELAFDRSQAFLVHREKEMAPASESRLKRIITCLDNYYKNLNSHIWLHLRDGENGMRLGIEAGKLLDIMKGEGLKQPLPPEELERHSTVTFIIGDEKIEADYEIIARVCPEFVMMLFGDFVDAYRDGIELDGIDPESFRSLIAFIEGKKLIKLDDMKRIIAIYSLAEKYQINFLKKILPKCLAELIVPGNLHQYKIYKLIEWNPSFVVETACALGMERASEIANEFYLYIEDLKDDNRDGKNDSLISTATKTLVDWINKAQVPLRELTSVTTPEQFFRLLDSSLRDLHYINFKGCPIPEEERSLLWKYEDLEILDDQKRSQLIESFLEE